MNWEALGAVGEIIAAAAVIASLLFVGYQLRQSQRAERAAGQRDVLRQAREWIVGPRDDPATFRTIAKLLEEFESASPDEQLVFDSWAFDCLLLIEQVIYMHDDEFLNETSRRGFEAVMLSILVTPGGAQWWKRAKKIWNQDHADYFDRLLEERSGTPRYDTLYPHYRDAREAMRQEGAHA